MKVNIISLTADVSSPVSLSFTILSYDSHKDREPSMVEGSTEETKPLVLCLLSRRLFDVALFQLAALSTEAIFSKSCFQVY
ncbi:MAG TPA: hypothetical protein VH796_19250 [Nitrososphaeraceae archaeon]